MGKSGVDVANFWEVSGLGGVTDVCGFPSETEEKSNELAAKTTGINKGDAG